MKYLRRSATKGAEEYGIVVPRIFNHYRRPRSTAGERTLGESVVSIGGYIDSLELIGQLLEAGENVQAFRMATSGMSYMYDVVDGVGDCSDDDIALPKTRTRGFDLIEWSNLKRDIEGKIVMFKDMNQEFAGASDSDNKSADSEQVGAATPPTPAPVQ